MNPRPCGRCGYAVSPSGFCSRCFLPATMTRERSLAMDIVKALHERSLSPERSPAVLVWDCIEGVIVEHRKRHEEPTGEPTWQ